MAKDIVMPKMGYDMTEGKLLRWIKHEGDTINKGEAVAEIETDKVNIEVEAFDAGVLQRILVQEGETVPVGQPIGILAAPGETPPAEQKPETAAPTAAACWAQSRPRGPPCRRRKRPPRLLLRLFQRPSPRPRPRRARSR